MLLLVAVITLVVIGAYAIVASETPKKQPAEGLETFSLTQKELSERGIRIVQDASIERAAHDLALNYLHTAYVQQLKNEYEEKIAVAKDDVTRSGYAEDMRRLKNISISKITFSPLRSYEGLDGYVGLIGQAYIVHSPTSYGNEGFLFIFKKNDVTLVKIFPLVDWRQQEVVDVDQFKEEISS
jgi:hypothetical protein